VALTRYTEEPIRQGRLDSPWEETVGGAVLGDVDEATALMRAAEKDPGRQAEAMWRAAVRARPDWGAIVRAAETILGRGWGEMAERHGDWGRDGTVAVATRHLGWRLVEVVKLVPELSYAAAAQGTRRFWRRAENRAELADFVHQLRQKCQ
jgi:hypothetical protein